MVLPMQVGDPRLTTDRWHEVGQEQRAAEEARQKREAIEADRARREFYSRPVTWPLSFTSLARANAALGSPLCMARCAGGRPSLSWAARATIRGDCAQHRLACWQAGISQYGQHRGRGPLEPRSHRGGKSAPSRLCFLNLALDLFAGDAPRERDNLCLN